MNSGDNPDHDPASNADQFESEPSQPESSHNSTDTRLNNGASDLGISQDGTDFLEDDEESCPVWLRLGDDATQSIDIGSLFTSDLTDSGSFDMRGKILTTAFGKLLQALPTPALLVDPNDTIVVANQACGRLSPTYDKMLDQSFTILFSQQDARTRALDLLRSVFRTRQPRLAQMAIHLDGYTLWCRFTFRSIRMRGLRYVLLLLEDLTREKRELLRNKKQQQLLRNEISERKRIESALKASETRFREFADLLPQFVFELNGKSDITFMNRVGLEESGYTWDDISDGLNALDLVAVEDRDLARDRMLAVLQGNKSTGYDYTMVRRDGTTMPMVSYSSPVLRDGKVVGIRGVGVDITELKRAEDALRKSEHKYRLLVERANDGIAVIQDGFVRYTSPSVERILGYSSDESVGQLFQRFVHPGAQSSILERYEIQSDGTHVPGVYETIALHKDGHEVHIELNSGVVDHEGSPADLIIIRDITERKRTEAELQLAKKIIEVSSEGMVVTDCSATITDVNEAFCRISGYSRAELIGNNPRILNSGRHSEKFYHEMWASLLSKGQWRGEIWDRRKSGEIYPKLLSINAVTNHRDEVTHYVGFSADISKLKKTEKTLQLLAHFDPLTGLANRTLLKDRLNQAIVEARRKNHLVALLLLDLDRFKDINDTLGHPVGDRLLIEAGKRLSECFREADTVSRWGGDEFVVVIPELHTIGEASVMGRRIMQSLSKPFDLNDRQLYVTCSIGMAVFPSDGDEIDTLLRHCDTALYKAKEDGRNRMRFFSMDMNRELLEKTELETDLRSALKRDELELHYQPIVSFKTGLIAGAEALIRWNHPTKGYVSPQKLIAMAEETGLIHPLGEWVLKEACRQQKQWQQTDRPPLPLAVNVSGHQFAQQGFVDLVSGILADNGLEPRFLELELTETVAMTDLESTLKVFQQLSAMGVSIVIDDFGTGYSSLNYLKRLPIDKLKIDRSFLVDVESNRDSEAVVRAIISVGHSLGLKVLSEGVETKRQALYMWALGADQWQGFYCARPDTAERFAKMLARPSAPMPHSLEWTPDLSVNYQRIDQQHKHWFRRVNEICKSAMQGVAMSELTEFIGFLEDYSRLHFRDEEALMIEHNYPGYKYQKQAHTYLVNQIQELTRKISTKEAGVDMVVEVILSMHDWFENHIEAMDRKLGEYLQSLMPKKE